MEKTLMLVPVDFSDCAAAALRYAAELSSSWNSELVLVHVVDPRLVAQISEYSNEPVEEVKERLSGHAKKAFHSFITKWDVSGLVKETLVSHGLPFQEIALKARELEADVILMGGYGSKGEGQIEELFFGSTVEKVVRLLPCPVLCVPLDWTP